MNLQQIAKLWTVVSTVLVFYTLNSWLVSQGGTEIFDIKLVHAGRIPAAMIAIIVCACLLIIASLIGVLHAKRSAPNWHARIPTVGFDTITTGSPEGKTYQCATLILLNILPTASLIHFWDLLLSERVKVVTTHKPPRLLSSIWDTSGITQAARICEDLDSAGACKEGATFFPVIEPLALIILTVLAVLAIAWHWYSLFQQKSQVASAVCGDCN